MRKLWSAVAGCPLQVKVSGLLLIGSLLPLLMVAALLLSRERDAARDANVALLDARVDQIGHTLETMYRGYAAAATRAARDPEVVAFFTRSPEKRSHLRGVVREHLRVFRGDDAAIRGVGLVDGRGKVLAATEPELVGLDVAHRDHFRRAMGGTDAISEVHVAAPGLVPSVAFSSPVRSQRGEIVGACVIWLRAAALWNVMQAANGTAGRGSFFALFDRHGLRVGHSLNEKVLFHPSEPLPHDVAAAMLADRRFEDRTPALLASVIPFPFHEIRGQERRIFRRPASPTNHVVNLAVAHFFPVLGGTLVAHIPESEVEVPWSSVCPRVLPALLVGLVLAVLGGALMMRHVVWPIRRMAATASALERGHFTPGGSSPGRAAPPRDEVGALSGAFDAMARSLADRERCLLDRNRELERHQRALVLLGKCNEALVRATDERSLLQAVCDTIVRVGGYRLCWVGFAEDDERKSVLPAAQAGEDQGYVSAADVVWADTERGRGPVGTAIRTRMPAVTRSVASDPALQAWRAAAATRGYRSIAALPLLSDAGAALGVLAIYAGEEDAFDEHEFSLLRELADDLAYGIMALRGRAERLQMTAKLLEADRMVAVGTLAAGLAHEINNPLAYVVSALHFVEDEVTGLERELPAGRLDEVKQALADAREGAGRVTTIVRDVKTLSRAEEKAAAAVDLRRVLDSSISMAFNEIKHRARLVKEYGPVPDVLAGEGRLGQVFVNLLVNAAQAIPEGNASENEIRVSTRTDEAGRAVIEVRDTGTGMSADVARRIFDPFFTTKPIGVGTGLGLFICRNIVVGLGGDIAVESREGAGTAFRVTLAPAPARAEAQAARAGTRPDAAPCGSRGRVLVVDDEPAVGSAVRRLLRGEHDVAVLTSAREARDRIARGERYDVILCDLMMPNMTGMELHAELAELAPDQAGRMVLLSGGAFTPGAREFVDRWPHARLEKPIDAVDLRAAVRDAVARAQGGARPGGISPSAS